ncbi:P27 family phage terminase small subunit [Rhizobium sp. PL01]|uniref:P27 family phage terminase small subunit n=1 Tax=Rhizobium sp. PL01 TaxID=3085631 RepID=UPI002980CBF2|nr:P27 family phage terminase small subunit [Rhizobium sp. PL01]MDW5314089.1 P27 family phage terminase small subunit [Rhizobium sp. PL01]
MTHLRGVKPPVSRDSNALTKAPAPPKHLSPYARAEWKLIMPGLIERGIATKSDLSGIAELCTTRGLARTYGEALSIDPLDKVTFGMFNRATQTSRQLAAEYGLSPVSRARVGSAAPIDDEPNAMDME